MREFCYKRFLLQLRESYSDRRNTFPWALLIWSAAVFAFAVFLPVESTLYRATFVAAAWTAVHNVRRL